MKLAILDAIILGVFAAACGAAPQPAGAGCELGVRFSDETRQTGEAAIARINAATGCEIHEAEDGVPVVQVSEALDAEGDAVCGTTTIARQRSTGAFIRVTGIEVSSAVDGCNSAEAIIVHELFHAMLTTSNVHAQSGVFAEFSGNGESINEDTLLEVCTHMVCPSFSPELSASE